MAEPLDLASYVTRVAAILGDAPGRSPDARERANVLARRVIDNLRGELEELAELRAERQLRDDAIRAFVEAFAAFPGGSIAQTLASGEGVEHSLKTREESE
jgi:hypothetical protein